ncbi:MAG: macro domain-containing protein, partial [Myxococcota bacterium]
MKVIHGDLLELAEGGHFDVIVHGCNCQCTMGAGIARQIKARFPEAYDADRATEKGDASKLGTCSVAHAQRGDHELTMVNAYTQVHWRGRGKKVDEDAIARCFAWVKQEFGGKRIGIPRIGAGLAGGDWDEIRAI